MAEDVPTFWSLNHALCRKSEDCQNFGQDLCEFVRHSSTRWDLGINLEAFENASNFVEEFD